MFDFTMFLYILYIYCVYFMYYIISDVSVLNCKLYHQQTTICLCKYFGPRYTEIFRILSEPTKLNILILFSNIFCHFLNSPKQRLSKIEYISVFLSYFFERNSVKSEKFSYEKVGCCINGTQFI